MSLVTSVKDYVEITHKLIEIEPLRNYTEFGAVFTYVIFSVGDFLKNIFSFSLFKNIWSIPIIVPDIASAMISEVSVLDGYFHNVFTFLETNVNTGTNPNLVIFEKFMIGLINSLFLILPTSTSHLITLRRFVMQGLEAGYMAGLGTLAGNFLWLSSIILGLRFFVVPWLSLDIFRYLLGFILLVKYIWDSSKERRMALEDLSKWKIFLLNFLLTLTEQSCIYPFISNLSIGPDASILEGFPVENYTQFLAVHGAYLFGILLGSFSLLQFTCWFWENPAFSIYLWITTKSSLKISTSSYYKILNFTFLYATMLCAIASIPYYGLDYTITNPIGLVPQDRILDQKKSQSDPDKLITETSFLGINPTDKNSRIRDGVHARRERWKQRLIKYQAFDASLYDQGVYDFLTIEDLNYGFDRFWLRRKMRNHQIRFRLFPGPWMRTLKKQLNNPANPSLESSNKAASGPRVEFFRILFEQFYHPNFHQSHSSSGKSGSSLPLKGKIVGGQLPFLLKNKDVSTQHILPVKNNTSILLHSVNSPLTFAPSVALGGITKEGSLSVKPGLIYKNSALRKYVRNVNTRVNLKLLNTKQNNLTNKYNTQLIYSKRWKSVFSKIRPLTNTKNRESYHLFRKVAKQLLLTPETKSLKLKVIQQKLSTQENKLLNLRTKYSNNNSNNSFDKLLLLRPLNIYLQKEQAFKRKLRYYGTTPMRKLTVGNQAPYFKALMKRGFYYYKPSLRWKKTLYVASMRRGFRKKSRKQRILIMPESQHITNISSKETVVYNPENTNNILTQTDITKPTHSYTVLGKRASRYRHQIYKDVLQHWYYTPFNRLLLKFDVDAFINRQPKSHFLTKNEERILHIRRFLLSEHYDTLRWYTYMQHYQTMKTNIGGTKSFANRTYNQQFQGTFKKLRHLFAITPKQGDLYTLKFDQPLYNDNKLKDNVYFHEELLSDNYGNGSLQLSPEGILPTVSSPQSGTTSSLTPLSSSPYGDTSGGYRRPDTDNKVANNVIPNNLDLINQSIFLIEQNKNSQVVNGLNNIEVSPGFNHKGIKTTGPLTGSTSKEKNDFIYSELFVKLIKECKKRVHDQAFLKNYITYRMEKREQLNQEQTKELTKRLEKLKIWLSQEQKIKIRAYPLGSPLGATASPEGDKDNLTAGGDNHSPLMTTTGIQKAVNDSIETKAKVVLTMKPTYNELNTAYTIQTEEQILNKLKLIKNNNIGQKTSLEKAKQLLQNTIHLFKPILLGQTQVLKARTDKNLQWWRKKQRVITKRKNSRKRDRFKKQIAVVNKKLAALSKKVETEKSNKYKTLYGNYEISDYLLTNVALGANFPQNIPRITDSALLRKKQDNSNSFADNQNIWQGFFSKKLRKKVSSKGRRYRSLSLARYLTATRKPRLVGLDGLTKLDNISSLKGSFLTKEEKQERLTTEGGLQRSSNEVTLKKSQIKKRSRHTWKKRARHQFSRNHYKYRKRHIHGNGKLRVMNKKLKKLKATNELRQWWWTSFLPRYLNKFQTGPQRETPSIIGNVSDISFKPLSHSLKGKDSNITGKDPVLLDTLSTNNIKIKKWDTSVASPKGDSTIRPEGQPEGLVLPESNPQTINLTTTSLPFYAGWDESLRKFVVTNRVLSRRDASMKFTNTPIQGLNEGSFLYWQTDMPFNSYNIDQFITTNQSFYAPLGWRRFEFRHSILKTWVNYSQRNFARSATSSKTTKNKTLIVTLPYNNQTQNQESINTKKAVARRIKKRYKLLKQMPNQLMYSPTGPLLTQVLPSHYISVFDQQYRFPRNRYLKRNTLKTMKKTTLLAMIDSANSNNITKEFTLRKRVKPRRKYHRKRFIKKDGLIFPRRTKFTTQNLDAGDDDLRWRPSNRSKQKRKETLRSKTKSNKRVKTNPLRLRQLRRREFQQILKPIQRYIPHNGGFAWPGDYLRLEIVEMPKLKSTNIKKTSLKQKINVQPVGIMPRKYLIEKHNIKVLKKKLEKAYSSRQLNKVVKEYKNLFQNQK